MKITRRHFIRGGLSALAGAGAVGLYTWRIEPHWVQIVRRALPVANLPSEMQGHLLVQLSDLHVGPKVDSEYLIRTLERVAELKPHIVVFTGDFVTYRSVSVLDELSHVLEAWPIGKHGTVAVLGNHDYGPGWGDLELAAQVERRVGRAGIHVLRNARTNIGGLDIVGLDDLWGPRFDPAAALSAMLKTKPTVVLCHNPDGVDKPGWSGYRGWILAGHTHGGQCKPPFLSPPLLPVRNKRYTAGEIDLTDGRRMYINRGLGHLLRVRFNVRPEITLFELQRG